MKHYLYDLYAAGKLKELENAFEDTFDVKAICALSLDQLHLRIVVADYLFQFVGAYTFTDFDCMVWSGAPFGFQAMPKSEKKLNNQAVKNFYFQFMKNAFEHYDHDFRAKMECMDKEDDNYINYKNP